MASEGEALVEALRSGVTYYAIQEFRVIPDFAGRRPQLQKEAVPGKSRRLAGLEGMGDASG